MKNTFKVGFYAKKPRNKNQEKWMIYARITICGQKCQFSTTYKVRSELWDVAKHKAIGDSLEAVELNSLLDYLRARIILSYNTRINTSKNVSPHLIKSDIFGSINRDSMLLLFFRDWNENRKRQIGYGIKQSTHNKYELTVRRLEEYILMTYNAQDVSFQRITLKFILNFESFLQIKYRMSHSSVGKLVKIFKRIILIAIEEGIMQHNPFRYHKTKSDTPARVFLNENELGRVISVRLDSRRLDRVRDIFLFCCFTGLSYADLLKLNNRDIHIGSDGTKWIIMKRLKTSTESRIKLMELPTRILEKYRNFRKGKSLLPVISNANFNKYIKEIASICEIHKRITVHTARHTFATTVALSNGLPIETLSKVLGHKTIRTTQVYAQILDDKINEDMGILDRSLMRLQSQFCLERLLNGVM